MNTPNFDPSKHETHLTWYGLSTPQQLLRKHFPLVNYLCLHYYELHFDVIQIKKGCMFVMCV